MYTILLADDELIEREYLKSIFKKYPGDYIVIGEASNGEQVIKIANNLKPDIVIMDISMPIINGLEAAKKIKEIFEDTIIILNSAYSEFEFAQKAINYNLDSYLLKPANEKEIIDTIQSSIYKSKDISSSQIRKSQKLETDYPYELIDDLVVSIQAKDLDLLDFSSNTYINYLKKSKTETGDNRIFVINTIFTVMRIMKQSYPEDARCLLRCEGYINDVSQVEYSHKIVSLAEEFFVTVRLLVKNYSLYSSNFTDNLEKYLDENFQKDISLESLSEKFHFSPTYLSRKFHQDKGLTINSYLKNKRIEYSIHLLKDSDIPINDLASKSGYNNISHFNRVFKEVTGKTPTEYRSKGVE